MTNSSGHFFSRKACILTSGGLCTATPRPGHPHPHTSWLDKLNISSLVCKDWPTAPFYSWLLKHSASALHGVGKWGGSAGWMSWLASIINCFQCQMPMTLTSDFKYLFRKEINQGCSALEVTSEAGKSNSSSDIDRPLQHWQ